MAFTLSLVFAGSYAATKALGLRRATDLALGTAVLAMFQVVATVLAAAGLMLRRLHPAVLIATTVPISGALIGLCRRHLPNLTNLRRLLSRLRAVRPANVCRLVRARPWESALTLVAIGELGWRTLIAYALPPYGWDALWYHLTTVASWVTTERIGTVPFALLSNIFPSNFEAVGAWMVTFTHTTTGLTGLELPFALLGAAAVMSLARTFGIARAGAVAAGSIFFLTPVVLLNTTSNYTDLAAASLVLVALALALRAIADLRADPQARTTAPLLLLAGIAGGLAIGTKSTAVCCIGVLSLVLSSTAGPCGPGPVSERQSGAWRSSWCRPLRSAVSGTSASGLTTAVPCTRSPCIWPGGPCSRDRQGRPTSSCRHPRTSAIPSWARSSARGPRTSRPGGATSPSGTS